MIVKPLKLTKKQRDFYRELDVNLTIKNSAHINSVIEELYPKLKLTKANSRIAKSYLKVILLNLYQNYMINKKLLTGFDQNNNKWKPKSRYNTNQVSKAIIPIKTALYKAGYIDWANGYKSYTPWVESRTARIRAKLKLINIIRKHKVESNQIEKLPNTECIIVQVKDGKKKTKIEYNETKDIKKLRADLIKYNNLLRKTHIDLNEMPEEGVIFGNADYPVAITDKNKFVRRIFNDAEFASGGRYYGGWWQSLSSEWRNKININGMPTMEYDYANNGINILYCMEGYSPYDGDAYDLSPTGYINNKYSMKELRPLLKLMLLIMINAKSRPQAFEALKADMRDRIKELPQLSDPELRVLAKKFEELHKPITKHFYSSYGPKLYLLDSTIASEVVNHFTAKGIAVLCIHDSFVIGDRYSNELLKVMRDSWAILQYQKALTKSPNISSDQLISMSILDYSKGRLVWEEQTKSLRWKGFFEKLPLGSFLKTKFPDGTEKVRKKQLWNHEAYKRFNDFNKLDIEDNYYYDDNK
jgi:hypothetical protein